jgi:uroporphyrinogen-III synthase
VGVESYCSLNTIDRNTILFAIGNTTAAALKDLNNKVIISEVPGKEDVVNTMINYYKTKEEKTTHE